MQGVNEGRFVLSSTPSWLSGGRAGVQVMLENLYYDNGWCDDLEKVIGILGGMENKNRCL